MSLPVNVETFWMNLQQAVGSASKEVFGDPFTMALTVLGISILVVWLFGMDGLGSLRCAPVKRHRVYPFIPPLLLLLWIGLTTAGVFLHEAVYGKEQSAPSDLMSYSLNVSIELSMTAIMLLLAHVLFARGLKGIGLNPNTLGCDLKWSVVHLAAIFPLIMAGIWLVLLWGRLFKGTDFSLDGHESLVLLKSTESMVVRLFVAVFAVLIAPAFEELLFRGFLQNSISAWTDSPWPAIVAVSLLFTMLHPSQHRLSLFFLSCGLGYAYERSGSLFRPILMHTLFNGFNVALIFAQPAS